MLFRVLISTALCLGFAQIKVLGQLISHQPGKIIVKMLYDENILIAMRNGVPLVGVSDIDTLNVRHRCSSIEKIYLGSNSSAKNLFLFSFPDDSNVFELAKLYSINGLSHAEPDLLLDVDAVPNDPLYSQQWGLPKIKAPIAWDIEKGNASIVISLNDTGLDWEHPDMQANVWINDEEDINENGVFDNFPASSGGDLDGIDNDSNGYTDDVIGWNFNNGNNNPQHTTGSHGTHVAGTAAAVTNNSTGIAGVSWNSKIMACRVGDGSSINVSNAVAGIYYAIDNGAKVINMSWSGSGTIPPSLNTAIVTATNNNVTLIASAGNENNSNPRYPASHALVLGVAALNEDDTKHGSSSYGTWIDISAPAFNVFLNYYSEHDKA